jgi:hypothetical protein
LRGHQLQSIKVFENPFLAPEVHLIDSQWLVLEVEVLELVDKVNLLEYLPR